MPKNYEIRLRVGVALSATNPTRKTVYVCLRASPPVYRNRNHNHKKWFSSGYDSIFYGYGRKSVTHRCHHNHNVYGYGYGSHKLGQFMARFYITIISYHNQNVVYLSRIDDFLPPTPVANATCSASTNVASSLVGSPRRTFEMAGRTCANVRIPSWGRI
jgi:hypothetical protein